MRDASHPIYGLLKFLSVIASVTVILYANASRFDETELKAIGEITCLILAGKYGERVFGKKEG